MNASTAALPRVALVGRMNVGKSALFNRLSESGRALVSSHPGTTRDTNEATVAWQRRSLTLIDTGGMDVAPDREADKQAVAAAERAATEADVMLFVVDVRSGCTPTERTVAASLRATRVPVLLVPNKADTSAQRSDIDPAFYELGFPVADPVSARSGVGTGDLLDRVIGMLPDRPAMHQPVAHAVSVSIIGRPNAGKSSLLNLLSDSMSSIVSDEPFTTRETRSVTMDLDGMPIALRDTAGIRRPSRVRSSKIATAPLEEESVRQSITALRDSDVVLLVIDATEQAVRQDQRLARTATHAKASIIIVLNKIDLISEDDLESVSTRIRNTFPMIDWAPIVCTSSTGGRGKRELLQMISLVIAERARRVPDELLEQVRARAVAAHLPTRGKGTRFPVVHLVQQMSVNPPSFRIVLGMRQALSSSYVHFLERSIREAAGFIGTPIHLRVDHADQRALARMRSDRAK